ncbi:MAG TPA: divalent-cation tolerance protein CutA [Acidobacteriota bacterium]|nr:divalent-cation tolerance protein CutA [Acidobacteriota bacterium]
MTRVRIVFSTIDDAQKARHLAGRLVEEGLAACVNIIPKVLSVYKWKGQVQQDEEWLMVIKTADTRLHRLLERLRELHPYDVPEGVAFPVESGLPDYLEWVMEETRGPDQT